MADFLEHVLRGLGVRLPFLLVCVGGLVLVTIRWSRQPRASLMALLGLAVLLVSSLATIVAFDLVARATNNWGWAMDRVDMLFTATSFLFYAVDAVGVALLVVAVYRGKPA